MVFMLILSHSIILLCKFTPPHEFSKFSGRKVVRRVQEIEEQRLILGLRSSEERSLLVRK